MSIQEVSAEQLAELFHHYHQALGPDFGGASKADPEAWEQVAPQKKKPPGCGCSPGTTGVGRSGPKLRRLKAVFRKTW